MPARAEGVAAFVNRLEKFDKDISKQMKKEIKAASRPLVAAVKDQYPDKGLRNWGKWYSAKRDRDLAYSLATVKRQTTVRQSKPRRSRGARTAFGYTVFSANAGAGIIELAGKKNAGIPFNRNIIAKHGSVKKMPRFAPKAYYEVAPGVRSDIEKIVQDAMRKVGL